MVKYWFPELSKSSTKVKSNSWFNINTYKNPTQKLLKNRKINLTRKIISCLKVTLYPTREQKDKLQIWFNKFIDMHNITNDFLRTKIIKENEIIQGPESLTLDFDKMEILEITEHKNNVIKEKKERTIDKNTMLHAFYKLLKGKETDQTKEDIIKIYQEKYKDHMIKLNEENITKYLNTIILRDRYLKKAKQNLASECKINIHILDEAIDHNVARYKSAITNFKRGHIDTFRMPNLDYQKRCKILIIEAHSFSKKILINKIKYDTTDDDKDKSYIKEIIKEEFLKIKNFSDKDMGSVNATVVNIVKNRNIGKIFPIKENKKKTKSKKSIPQLKVFINREFKRLMKKDKNQYHIGFCMSQIGNVECSSEIKNIKEIKKTCTIHYDKLTSIYTLIIPRKETTAQVIKRINLKKKDKNINQDGMRKVNKCGGDPGVRTFLTVYSENEIYDICSSVIDKLRRYYLIIEQIHVDFKVFKMRKKAYSIKRNKIETRIKNLVKDMHWKTAKFLCENYDEIHLGKINTLSIISNETSNIDNTTKRVLLSLSHSKFRERLKHQAKKADSNVRLINEHMTTKTCHSCGKIKEVGSSKTYKCECKVEIGRDINAAINIYKKVEYIVEEDSDDDKED